MHTVYTVKVGNPAIETMEASKVSPLQEQQAALVLVDKKVQGKVQGKVQDPSEQETKVPVVIL